MRWRCYRSEIPRSGIVQYGLVPCIDHENCAIVSAPASSVVLGDCTLYVSTVGLDISLVVSHCTCLCLFGSIHGTMNCKVPSTHAIRTITVIEDELSMKTAFSTINEVSSFYHSTPWYLSSHSRLAPVAYQQIPSDSTTTCMRLPLREYA